MCLCATHWRSSSLYGSTRLYLFPAKWTFRGCTHHFRFTGYHLENYGFHSTDDLFSANAPTDLNLFSLLWLWVQKFLWRYLVLDRHWQHDPPILRRAVGTTEKIGNAPNEVDVFVVIFAHWVFKIILGVRPTWEDHWLQCYRPFSVKRSVALLHDTPGTVDQ